MIYIINNIKMDKKIIVPRYDNDSMRCCFSMIIGVDKSELSHINNDFNIIDAVEELKKHQMKIRLYINARIFSLNYHEHNLRHGIFLTIIYRGNVKDILEKTARLDVILIVNGKIYDPLFNTGGFALKDSVYEMMRSTTIYKISSTK